jgi:transposase
MFLSEGQMSDYKGARMLLPSLPKAKTLIADRGYDADWFRAALRTKGITPCIPAKRNRKIKSQYDKTLYRQRHRDREHVRAAQGLVQDRHALRPLRPYLLLSHLHCRTRHLLSQLMSPAPSKNKSEKNLKICKWEE